MATEFTLEEAISFMYKLPDLDIDLAREKYRIEFLRQFISLSKSSSQLF